MLMPPGPAACSVCVVVEGAKGERMPAKGFFMAPKGLVTAAKGLGSGTSGCECALLGSGSLLRARSSSSRDCACADCL